ncbi:MAG: hypothetical protein KJ063_11265 [Anaerolineae bacterium]|nr:hypothetical protein [Anaerolineae bacterium]
MMRQLQSSVLSLKYLRFVLLMLFVFYESIRSSFVIDKEIVKMGTVGESNENPEIVCNFACDVKEDKVFRLT